MKRSREFPDAADVAAICLVLLMAMSVIVVVTQ
jgi:hypothetical protein